MKSISLNKKLYSRESIDKATDFFSDLCEIKVVEQPEYFVIMFNALQEPVDGVEKEFANHCIGMMR